jgi:hypothetical protein
MSTPIFGLGSARVSRAGERVLAIANFSLQLASLIAAATPKPARGTRALPRD